MTYHTNEVMMEDPDFPRPQGALPVWSQVFTKPGEATFARITAHPEATAKAAYIWVFIAGTLSGLINSLLQTLVTLAGIQQAAPNYGGMPSMPAAYGLGGLIGAICAAPVAGLASVIGFAIGVAIVHATARFFGGEGSFDRMAYAFGAIAAPISLISALTIPLNAIPFVVFCTAPVMIALSLYAVYLQVAAIKAVHRLGWGESVGALFLPAILFALLCGVLFLVLMRVLGPSVMEIFQQIQQGLPR